MNFGRYALEQGPHYYTKSHLEFRPITGSVRTSFVLTKSVFFQNNYFPLSLEEKPPILQYFQGHFS